MKKVILSLCIAASVMIGFASNEVKTSYSAKKKQVGEIVVTSGRTYEASSQGIVIYQAKPVSPSSQKLAPRVVAIAPKPLAAKPSDAKVQQNAASSHTFEVDLFRLEF
jgi:hypothetical protein